MKLISAILAGLLSLGIIVMSHVAWVERTSVNGNTSVNTNVNKEAGGEISYQSSYLAMAANWPEAAIQSYAQSLENEEPYTLVLVGSDSSMGEEDGWAAQVASALDEHYQDSMTVEIVHFDGFSGAFHMDEVASLSPDLVVIEPFLMKDNDWYGDVSTALATIGGWREVLQEANPDVTVMLQPANPFYLPQKYQEQVDALKAYAEEEDLVYLNHWEAWPDTTDTAISTYLEGDYYPNEDGHEVWAEYLVDYFIVE